VNERNSVCVYDAEFARACANDIGSILLVPIFNDIVQLVIGNYACDSVPFCESSDEGARKLDMIRNR